MGDVTAAVRVELLKLRRSRTPWITALTFGLVALVDGLFMVILKYPAAARSWGLLGAKAQLTVGVADTPTALGFLAEATGIGGLFVFGLVFIWVFGREFADRTVKDLLALPVPRTAIVAAKFTVATAWCLVLAAWTGALGVGVVTALRLPGADAGTVGPGLIRLLLTATMTIALVAPFALLASVARGYLAPVGGILLATSPNALWIPAAVVCGGCAFAALALEPHLPRSASRTPRAAPPPQTVVAAERVAS